MQANRSRDTQPELAVRRLLHAQGLRYRIDFPPIPSVRRRADIVFRKQRVAVFIDGCFWHGCSDHYVAPKSNAQFWRAKVEMNRSRDLETNMLLESAGWIVLRFWEHENPIDIAGAVVAGLHSGQK